METPLLLESHLGLGISFLWPQTHTNIPNILSSTS